MRNHDGPCLDFIKSDLDGESVDSIRTKTVSNRLAEDAGLSPQFADLLTGV